jgi:hypothetical protein
VVVESKRCSMKNILTYIRGEDAKGKMHRRTSFKGQAKGTTLSPCEPDLIVVHGGINASICDG